MSDAYVINFGTKLDRQQLIAEADAVCKMDRKREVVWDVSKFTSVPWGELGFVADIMKKIKPFAKIKIIKNKIISTQKRKMIKFHHTNGPGLYTSSCEVFFCLIFWCVHLDVF